MSARGPIEGQVRAEAIEHVRHACLEDAANSDTNRARIESWFDIVSALNAARHRRNDKAEVRRIKPYQALSMET